MGGRPGLPGNTIEDAAVANGGLWTLGFKQAGNVLGAAPLVII